MSNYFFFAVGTGSLCFNMHHIKLAQINVSSQLQLFCCNSKFLGKVDVAWTSCLPLTVSLGKGGWVAQTNLATPSARAQLQLAS